MPIPASTVAAYAPWGNAELTFKVTAAGPLTVDPETGNPVPGEDTLEYLAALSLEAPNWQGQEGADQTTYRVNGRLLSPATWDPRITNGSQGDALINGYRGRLELTHDLQMDPIAYGTLRQVVSGIFRIIGGPPITP